MTIDEIFHELNSTTPGYRWEAVEAAVAQREAITPRLLALLDEAIGQKGQTLRNPDPSGTDPLRLNENKKGDRSIITGQKLKGSEPEGSPRIYHASPCSLI
jgi:hypothetical protein